MRSGEKLGLLRCELIVGDHTSASQLGQLGQFVGNTTGGAGSLANKGVHVVLLRAGPSHVAVAHAVTAHDHVDQHPDQWQLHHHNEPPGPRPATHVMAAEDVDHDVEEDEQPRDPNEQDEHRPEDASAVSRGPVASSRVHLGTSHDTGASTADQGDIETQAGYSPAPILLERSESIRWIRKVMCGWNM